MVFIATGKTPADYSCYTSTSASACFGRHVAHSRAQTRPPHESQSEPCDGCVLGNSRGLFLSRLHECGHLHGCGAEGHAAFPPPCLSALPGLFSSNILPHPPPPGQHCGTLIHTALHLSLLFPLEGFYGKAVRWQGLFFCLLKSPFLGFSGLSVRSGVASGLPCIMYIWRPDCGNCTLLGPESQALSHGFQCSPSSKC